MSFPAPAALGIGQQNSIVDLLAPGTAMILNPHRNPVYSLQAIIENTGIQEPV